jgi:hypothetical protein
VIVGRSGALRFELHSAQADTACPERAANHFSPGAYTHVHKTTKDIFGNPAAAGTGVIDD